MRFPSSTQLSDLLEAFKDLDKRLVQLETGDLDLKQSRKVTGAKDGTDPRDYVTLLQLKTLIDKVILEADPGWGTQGKVTYLKEMFGRIGIGTRTPDAIAAGEVNGAWLADAMCWLASKTSTTAGTGDFDWDNEVINTHSDLFSLDGTDTILTVNRPGHYLVGGSVTVSGLADGNIPIIDITQDSTIVSRNGSAVGAAGSSRWALAPTICEVATSSDFTVTLSTFGNRFGSAGRFATFFWVHKLN